jgi:hypothetical protein
MSARHATALPELGVGVSVHQLTAALTRLESAVANCHTPLLTSDDSRPRLAAVTGIP